MFRNMLDCAMEMDRELLQSGMTVPVKSYQNKKLEGDDQITKELMGVAFTISKPLVKREEAIEYLFGEDAKRIVEYCKVEFQDRVSPEILNPGNSYKIRLDLWQKFMVDDVNNIKKFDYTYNERYNRFNQLNNAIDALKNDIHTRQSIVQVYHPDLDSGKHGGITRIPCSMSYQFLIRNNQTHIIYYMRSNDMLSHYLIDLYLTAELMKYVTDKLKDTYEELQYGSLTYFAGSLHAYHFNLKDRVIF